MDDYDFSSLTLTEIADLLSVIKDYTDKKFKEASLLCPYHFCKGRGEKFFCERHPYLDKKLTVSKVENLCTVSTCPIIKEKMQYISYHLFNRSK